jgi:glycosyltransferase involved in cell wall biosynthesis
MKKIIRTATVSISLDILLPGQLSFLNSKYEIVAVSGKDKHLNLVAAREGVRVVDLPMRRAIFPFADLLSLIKLFFLFRKERPDMVHSITPKAGLLSMIAAYFAGVPIRVHTFTGLLFPTSVGFKKILLLNMDRLLCKFATHIYPEGEGVKNDLLNNKVTKKPLNVLANGNVNGIDVDFFSPGKVGKLEVRDLKSHLGIEENNFVFVFVGRLVQDKGINELVAAFVSLSKLNSNCKLLLVGSLEAELDPLFSTTIQNINNHPSIISAGWQDDIRPYLSISNVLVFPSYREGFPNVVLQAGAMGLPSIVTNINGCNEIIEDQNNGLIIPAKKDIELEKAMKKILLDKDLYFKLKNNSRDYIVSRYSQDLVWNALLDEYKKLLQ